MTDTNTSIVRVAIFEDEDYEVLFSDMIDNKDIVAISDFDIIALVAKHMKIEVEELNFRVYGKVTDSKLYVSRPETGNIDIHTEMVLGAI